MKGTGTVRKLSNKTLKLFLIYILYLENSEVAGIVGRTEKNLMKNTFLNKSFI